MVFNRKCIWNFSCTVRGPFVTNVSKDENGNLIVEKATVELNTFSGDIHLKISRNLLLL